MFAFEVEDARQRRREARAKEDEVDDFKDWLRWKRNNAVGETSQQPEASHKPVAVKDVPQGQRVAPAANSKAKPAGFTLVQPLTAEGGGELGREAVFALLHGVLTVGEDDNFVTAQARVAEAEEKPVSTWEQLLRVALLYHQTALHFSGSAAAELAKRGNEALAAMTGHPLGLYVQTMITTARISLAWGEANGGGKNRYVEALRDLLAAHGHENYYVRYVFGIRNWKRMGDMAQLVEIALTVQGHAPHGRRGQPGYCPDNVFSWVLYRIGMHNYKLVKKKMPQLSKKQLAKELLPVTQVLEKARAAYSGNDGTGASQAVNEQLTRVRDVLDKHEK